MVTRVLLSLLDVIIRVFLIKVAGNISALEKDHLKRRTRLFLFQMVWHVNQILFQ